MPEVRQLFSILATETPPGTLDISTVPTGARSIDRDVLIGLDGEGRRYVLVPATPGQSLPEDRSGKSIHLTAVRNGPDHLFAAVCLRRELDDIFVHLAEDVVTAVNGSEDPPKAMARALDRWRQLLADADERPPLSEAAVIGLRAELETLHDVLRINGARNLDIWSGPRKGVRDLQWPGGSIEVKATMVREGREIKISSLEQLDAPDGSSLHLAIHGFRSDPDGKNLNEVVDSVRGVVTKPSDFTMLLGEAGYFDHHRDRYESLRHRLVERRVYDVLAKGFPRIVPTSFIGGEAPPGTLRVSYTIDLTNEPPHPLSDGETRKIWKRAAE